MSACGFACSAGFSDCNGLGSDGCEVNTKSDKNNCGACGKACAGGLTCQNGACVLAPILFYTLDENAGTSVADSSGHAQNATAATGTGWTPGHLGSAYKGLWRTNGNLPAVTSLTFSAWVRRDGNGSAVPRIFNWGADLFDIADFWSGGNVGLYSGNMGLGWTDTGIAYGAGFHHLVVTASGTTINVYFDGTFRFTVNAPAALSLPAALGYFDQQQGGLENFNGPIDQVRIFDRVLSPAEITALAAE
jgi:hypothetical protein